MDVLFQGSNYAIKVNATEAAAADDATIIYPQEEQGNNFWIKRNICTRCFWFNN